MKISIMLSTLTLIIGIAAQASWATCASGADRDCWIPGATSKSEGVQSCMPGRAGAKHPGDRVPHWGSCRGNLSSRSHGSR